MNKLLTSFSDSTLNLKTWQTLRYFKYQSQIFFKKKKINVIPRSWQMHVCVSFKTNTNRFTPLYITFHRINLFWSFFFFFIRTKNVDFTKNGQRFSSSLLSNSNLVHHFYLPSLAILFHSPQPLSHIVLLWKVYLRIFFIILKKEIEEIILGKK